MQRMGQMDLQKSMLSQTKVIQRDLILKYIVAEEHMEIQMWSLKIKKVKIQITTLQIMLCKYNSLLSNTVDSRYIS